MALTVSTQPMPPAQRHCQWCGTTCGDDNRECVVLIQDKPAVHAIACHSCARREAPHLAGTVPGDNLWR